jgi:peptidyl-dipeptidase A
MKGLWLLGLLGAGGVLVTACAGPVENRETDPKLVEEVRSFLEDYTTRYVALVTEASEAEWALNTRIVEGDDTNKNRVETANGALADFTGSVEVIEKTRGYLERRDRLEPLQVKQLERILYVAANNPQTVPDRVAARIAREAEQTETLFGFDFRIGGVSVSTNDIDRVLRESSDEAERLAAWEASKEVGRELRDGLVDLVRLRNETVGALGYRDYFDYQVSDYGMTTDEMLASCERFVRETRPLYRELHTWARYELADRYGAEVPDLIPAHWLPNRWGQSWAPLVEVEGFDLDSVLKTKEPEWLIRQAERFYVSLGFEPLPRTFWERSSLYPLPPDAPYRKNNHASAWHMDLDRDVRCLQSIEPNRDWYETTHHELGHIYYFLAYSNPDVPPLLREGANRAFHEAVGSLLGMASMQRGFVEGLGLLPEGSAPDEIRTLLKEALDQIVFMPWSAGVMTRFEHDLYAGLSPAEYNDRWWDLVRRYQGIAPPSPRGEEFCDAATKTHINNDAAQYYDYAISFVLLHQFHDHIAREILEENPRDTNYHGRRDVGKFLDGILRVGATRDWRTVLREAVGEKVSARAMLEYYDPLLQWLRERNRGRTATLPEL